MMIDAPDSYYALMENFCSNFDHEINHAVAVKLKEEFAYAGYPAWHWHGKVWYDRDENKYCCRVLRYGTFVGTVYGATPEELKTELCKTYGND